MKFVILAAVITLPFGAVASSASDNGKLVVAQKNGPCTQVISCGTKNGKRKEYSTGCAAQADGATNIKPKTGKTCEASE